jgi:signal transduction histidine kinase
MVEGDPRPVMAPSLRLLLAPRPAALWSLHRLLMGVAAPLAATGVWWSAAYGTDGFHKPDVLGAALAAAVALPLAAPRRLWLMALGLSAIFLLAYNLIGFPPSPVLLAPLVLLCCVLATAPLSQCWGAFGFLVACTFAGAVLSPDKVGVPSLLANAVAFPLAAIAGFGTRSRYRRSLPEAAEPQGRTKMARQSEEDLVVKERLRLARELHDSVGHGISLMAIQTAAARALVSRDPDRARELLAQNDEVASGTMAELRRMLGFLRGAAPPAGTAMSIAGLCKRFSVPGLRVTLEMNVVAHDLPEPLIDVARSIIAEGLANVCRHAHASRAIVRVRLEDGNLVVEVEDDGQGLPAGSQWGFGLTGARERLEMLGGSLDLCPAGKSGAVLTAVVPLGQDIDLCERTAHEDARAHSRSDS